MQLGLCPSQTNYNVDRVGLQNDSAMQFYVPVVPKAAVFRRYGLLGRGCPPLKKFCWKREKQQTHTHTHTNAPKKKTKFVGHYLRLRLMLSDRAFLTGFFPSDRSLPEPEFRGKCAIRNNFANKRERTDERRTSAAQGGGRGFGRVLFCVSPVLPGDLLLFRGPACSARRL